MGMAQNGCKDDVPLRTDHRWRQCRPGSMSHLLEECRGHGGQASCDRNNDGDAAPRSARHSAGDRARVSLENAPPPSRKEGREGASAGSSKEHPLCCFSTRCGGDLPQKVLANKLSQAHISLVRNLLSFSQPMAANSLAKSSSRRNLGVGESPHRMANSRTRLAHWGWNGARSLAKQTCPTTTPHSS